MPPNRFRFRILAAAMLLPTAIVGADQLVLEIAGTQSWQWQATLLVFAGFVIQTGVLGYAVGRWLPNWPWRLGVLTWGIVLTNLLLFRAAVEGNLTGSFWSVNPVLLLCDAFLSAQWSAVTVWLMIGSGSLGTRLSVAAPLLVPPLTLLAMLMGKHTGTSRAEFWSAVMLVQFIATTGLTAFLSMFRWRIEYLDPDAGETAGPWLQFSVRHLLIGMTAAAVLTALGKAVVSHSPAGMGWQEWLQVAIDGLLLGALSLVAVWAALGEGTTVRRLTLLLLLAILLAGLLWWAETRAKALLSPSGPPAAWWFQRRFTGHWWMGWTLLAGGFLASWLLVMRVTGYRLVRHHRR